MLTTPPNFVHRNSLQFHSGSPSDDVFSDDKCSAVRRYLQEDDDNEEYIVIGVKSEPLSKVRDPDDDDLYYCTDALLTDRATIIEETEMKKPPVRTSSKKSVIFRIPVCLEMQIPKDNIRILITNFVEKNGIDADLCIDMSESENINSDVPTFCLHRKTKQTDIVWKDLPTTVDNDNEDNFMQSVEKKRQHKSKLDLDLDLEASKKICPYEMYDVYLHDLHRSTHLIFLDVECIGHKNPECQYSALGWLNRVIKDQVRYHNSINRTMIFSRDYLFQNMSGDISYTTELEEVLNIFSIWRNNSSESCVIVWLTNRTGDDNITDKEPIEYQFLRFTGCGVYEGINLCQLIWSKKDSKYASSNETNRWEVRINDDNLVGNIRLVDYNNRVSNNMVATSDRDNTLQFSHLP